MLLHEHVERTAKSTATRGKNIMIVRVCFLCAETQPANGRTDDMPTSCACADEHLVDRLKSSANLEVRLWVRCKCIKTEVTCSSVGYSEQVRGCYIERDALPRCRRRSRPYAIGLFAYTFVLQTNYTHAYIHRYVTLTLVVVSSFLTMRSTPRRRRRQRRQWSTQTTTTTTPRLHRHSRRRPTDTRIRADDDAPAITR